MGPWKFRFDASYTNSGPFWRADAPLSVDASTGFTRNVATVDPSGNPVSAGVPRFERVTYVAPVIAPQAVTVGSGGPAPESRVLASGVAANGTNPLTVFIDDDHEKLHLIYGNTVSLNPTTLTLVDLANMAGAPDATLAFAPTSIPTNCLLVPQTATVVHGLVVVAGAFLRKVTSGPDKYEVVGWGFAQRGSNSWQYLWDDSGISGNQPNHWRGREWCLHASLARNRGSNPTECWLACTDYRVQVSDSPPTGGRVFVLKFTRPSGTSTTWSLDWGSQTIPTVFYDDIPAGTGTEVPAGCHAHTAHIAEWGENGLQLVVSVGDAQYHSRFVRYTIPDVRPPVDYTVLSNWSAEPNGYHGYRQIGSALGSRSQQPMGVTLGPRATTRKPFAGSSSEATRSTLVWGSDEQCELFTRMILPEPGESPDQLWIEHHNGFATGFGSSYGGTDFVRLRALVFGIGQAKAENGEGALVAVLSNAGDADAEGQLAITRILYCPHQSYPDRWMQLATIWGRSLGTAGIHGGSVYFNAYSQIGGIGSLQKVPVPSDLTEFQPIVIAPGGKNLVVQSCYAQQGGQALDDNIKGLPQAIPPSGPTFPVAVDTLPDLTLRYLPPVPCVSARVLRIRTQRTVPGTSNHFICRIHLSGTDVNNWNQFSSGGWSTGSLVRRIRCWVLDGTWGVLTGQNGQSYPNKTAQMSMRTRDGSATGDPTDQGAPLLYSCSNRWCPLTIVGFRTITNSVDPTKNGLGIELLCASDSYRNQSGVRPPDDNYLYLAIDGAFEGNGGLPYPMALTEVNTAPQEQPPEWLTLSLGSTTDGYPLSFGSNWTLRLAGQVPIGNWDQYAERRGDPPLFLDERYWPLATLWADANNWIEVVANCKDKAFRVRYSVAGTITERDFGEGEQLWLPDSVLMVAISWNATDHKLYFGATLAGGAVATGPDEGIEVASWSAQTAPLSHLKFRGASDEVVEFRWIGGEFTDQPTTSAGIKSGSFTSIGFMEGP
ncbi:MAG: hypothetical protein JNL50_05805 [Phycisphaerae bacterium]|nr:hypothetical protein [Phycisphaerae bacterium]